VTRSLLATDHCVKVFLRHYTRTSQEEGLAPAVTGHLLCQASQSDFEQKYLLDPFVEWFDFAILGQGV
jgi:hypothetical protein